jgi:hypothetical protein
MGRVTWRCTSNLTQTPYFLKYYGNAVIKSLKYISGAK